MTISIVVFCDKWIKQLLLCCVLLIFNENENFHVRKNCHDINNWGMRSKLPTKVKSLGPEMSEKKQSDKLSFGNLLQTFLYNWNCGI